MPKESKKKKKKELEEGEQVEGVDEEEEEEVKEEDEIQKTSIQISTKVRDRLWRLKFRKTYNEFLWELCEMYESDKEEG